MSTEAAGPISDDPLKGFPPPAEATSRHVTVDGVRLHLRDYGGEPEGGETRPVLLCVHGSAANAHWFDYVATGLRGDHRVLSLFATVATHEHLAGALEARYGGLVDTLSLFIPPHTDPLPLAEAINEVQRIPISFRGHPRHW